MGHLFVYWREVGLSALWEVGVLLSINRFIRLPMTPLIGLLYKRMSLRKGLILAILLAAATTIGYSLFKGFIIWLVLGCLWGIAWSFLRMGGYLTVIRYSDDSNRGHLMGLYNGISRLGSLIGMLVGGLLAPLVGMQIVSIAFGVFMLLGLPYVVVYISGAKANEPDVSLLWKERLDNQESIWSKPVIKIVATGLVPWQLPIYLWCAVILLILAASTAVSTLMDALASDVAHLSSVVAVMTAYSVATDMGSALGPMLVYLAIGLPNGITYIYIGSAIIFLLVALWHRPNAKQEMTALPSERELMK
ncbi:hypothetical protein GCM10008018_57400 [Paenibacillus marchantiophytorum]|uniref:Major facilitator superfamily (MFS) profile domain-containing protein n=1 Tax=Paenibacillus marchantiophytorum TaxID=1619310 RepID=A0ABQ1FAQ1_9BACL|nr:MFS transporter [Paenibacillus marchantiophytorum]GGA03985.1 hypothetical protein GCM10008018_57400 [Paenibacillus marchantiophytorum]